MADHVLEKNQNGRKIMFGGNKASEVSISTNIDLLYTNLLTCSRSGASFPNKIAEMSNILKSQMTEYIDIALSDLVFNSNSINCL